MLICFVFRQTYSNFASYMTRSLFFDIDGTLVSFKTHEIPQSTIDALTQAKAKGVGIYISTGRPIPIITNLGAIEHLIDGYITTNGALCYVGDTIVCRHSIEDRDVHTALADADANDFACIVVGERDISVYNYKTIVKDVFLDEINVKGMDTMRPAAEVIAEQHILQLTPFIDADHEARLMHRMPHCVSGRWHPAFTDITSRKADKGNGLKAMAAHLGMDISETMAFGDGGNDIAIIRAAGIGVAMGNAGDDVKAIADYVTTSVDDDGIRNALLHFGVI